MNGVDKCANRGNGSRARVGVASYRLIELVSDPTPHLTSLLVTSAVKRDKQRMSINDCKEIGDRGREIKIERGGERGRRSIKIAKQKKKKEQ